MIWWICFWQLIFMCCIDRQLWCNPFWMVDTLWLPYKNQGWVPTISFHTMLLNIFVSKASKFFITLNFFVVKLFLLVGCVKGIRPKVYRFLSWHWTRFLGIELGFSCEILLFLFTLKVLSLQNFGCFCYIEGAFSCEVFWIFFCYMNQSVGLYQFHSLMINLVKFIYS
jgi:hypothetical protein